MLAIVPPAATMSWQISKVAGMPTASIAVSTPRPPVNAITCAAASPVPLLTVSVAPNCLPTARRLSSRSTMMICAGE